MEIRSEIQFWWCRTEYLIFIEFLLLLKLIYHCEKITISESSFFRISAQLLKMMKIDLTASLCTFGDDGASGGANLREQSELDVVLDEVAFR